MADPFSFERDDAICDLLTIVPLLQPLAAPDLSDRGAFARTLVQAINRPPGEDATDD